MLLNALFALQEEEASQTKIKFDTVKALARPSENPTFSECSKYATAASTYAKRYHGLPLEKLPMYSLTVSEILRLHFLSSGASINESGAKWRYQQRGGYTKEDDPGLYLRWQHPHLIKALSTHSIVQFSIDDKLKIISCLIEQLLTYADVRDVIEDRREAVKQQLKANLRNAQIAAKRKSAEDVSKSKDVKGEKLKDIKTLEDGDNDDDEDTTQKINELSPGYSEHQVFLGCDRAFRRYLKLESVPGLFVDSTDTNAGTCLSEVTRQNPQLVGADKKMWREYVRNSISQEMNTSDKENDPNKEVPKVNGTSIPLADEVGNCHQLLMCTADPKNCSVHSVERSPQIEFFHKPEQVDELVDSLNRRGVREGELQQVIQNIAPNLKQLIANTPSSYLNPVLEENPDIVKPNVKEKSKYGDTNLGYPTTTPIIDILHATLTENILDMEEKIFAGYLGTLKIRDRNEWRKCLTNSDYDNFDRTIVRSVENGKTSEENDDNESRESTPEPSKHDVYRNPDDALGMNSGMPDEVDSENLVPEMSEQQKTAIECLSIALAQIAHAIDYQYLKTPLGHAQMTQKQIRNCAVRRDILQKWELSLLASTSYSQVFLHYGTLHGSIIWSRSSPVARCSRCRLRSDSRNMVLCDNCKVGQHTYCIKPKIDRVPQSAWFCSKCSKYKEQETKHLNHPSPAKKRKRRIFRDEDIDEEEEEPNMEASVNASVNTSLNTSINASANASINASPTTVVEKVFETAERTSDDFVDDEGGDEDKTEDLKKPDKCTLCGSDGDLLCCEKCSNCYHVECLQPPLRRKPRGQWICNQCKEKETQKGNAHSRLKVQRTGAVLNQRRCATRARHKIHGFVKSLRGTSFSADSDSSIEVSTSSRRLGRREAEDLPLHNAALHDLLLDVMKNVDAWPFIRPVQKNEVPDYYDVITKPMDFGTIKYKLNMGKYSCDEEFMADAVLIFENCNTYNDTNADVYKCGVRLLRVFEKRSKELGLKLPEEMQEDESNRSWQPKNKKRRTK